MSAPITSDHAHTTQAARNRARKADALAQAAAALGMQPYELTLVGGTVADRGRRDVVRKHAGLTRAPSVETWTQALAALEAAALALPGVKPCPKCGAPVRRVLGASGNPVVLDPWAHPAGTVLPVLGADGTVTARVIAGHETPPDEPLFRQHVVSCPRSGQATERRRREAPRCPVCGGPMDGALAAVDPTYTAHPCCDPRGEVRPP